MARGARVAVLVCEMKRALRSPWFFVPLGIALVLAIASGIESYAMLAHENAQSLSYGYQLGLYAHNYLGQTRESSFGNWVVVSANAPLTASLFFYTLPLLAVIPFAWSYRSEAISGYAAQLCTRSDRASYVSGKYLTVFTTGFLIAAIPLIVNFLLVSCLFPAYMPRVEEANYVGLFDISLFSTIFYTQPLAYVAIYTLLDALLMGAWATVVLGLSVIVRDRVKLMVLPYLFLFAWHYVNGWFFLSLLALQGFNMNIFNSLRSESLLCLPSLEATLAELAVLLLFGAIASRLLARQEVA